MNPHVGPVWRWKRQEVDVQEGYVYTRVFVYKCIQHMPYQKHWHTSLHVIGFDWRVPDIIKYGIQFQINLKCKLSNLSVHISTFKGCISAWKMHVYNFWGHYSTFYVELLWMYWAHHNTVACILQIQLCSCMFLTTFKWLDYLITRSLTMSRLVLSAIRLWSDSQGGW